MSLLKLTFSIVTRVWRLLSRTCFSFVSCQGRTRSQGTTVGGFYTDLSTSCHAGRGWRGKTHIVLAAGGHHRVDHLARVVDAGDCELPQRALELHCRKEGEGKQRESNPTSSCFISSPKAVTFHPQVEWRKESFYLACRCAPALPPEV